MNILMLTTHVDTGGITSYILTLTKGLIERGHKVFVVSSGGQLTDRLKALGAEPVTLKIRTKSELSPKIYLNLPALCHFIREKNIQVIHAHTRVTQVMGTLLSRMTNRPFLSTCHGFFKNRLSRRIFPCWGRKVIAISDEVKIHLREDFKIPEEDIAVVYSGVDIKEFPLLTEEVRLKCRREFGLDTNPVAGIIARLSEVKGHSVLIEAWASVVEKIPTANLLIVGEGKTETDLKILVRKLNLEHRVKFLPIVDKTPKILSLLDIFVMPSLQEGLGLAVMEAQAMGLAVIASRVGGLPNLIKDGETGLLVSVQDKDALAAAIITLLSDRMKAKQMGEAGRRFIERNFSSDQMVEKILQCYQSLVHD